jgi:ketosteroid isomerase-like protein
MSQENVEVVRKAADAFNRLDPDAFIACLHPNVVWEERTDVSGLRGVYRGWAEVREWFADLLEVWESFHAEVVEITEAGDGLVFVGLFVTGRGAGSGVNTELRIWVVFSVADGKITRRQFFGTREEALEVLRLSE